MRGRMLAVVNCLQNALSPSCVRDALSWEGLARCLLSQMQYTSALKVMCHSAHCRVLASVFLTYCVLQAAREAIALAPQRVTALRTLATVLTAVGEHDEAATVWGAFWAFCFVRSGMRKYVTAGQLHAAAPSNAASAYGYARACLSLARAGTHARTTGAAASWIAKGIRASTAAVDAIIEAGAVEGGGGDDGAAAMLPALKLLGDLCTAAYHVAPAAFGAPHGWTASVATPRTCVAAAQYSCDVREGAADAEMSSLEGAAGCCCAGRRGCLCICLAAPRQRRMCNARRGRLLARNSARAGVLCCVVRSWRELGISGESAVACA